MPKNSKVHRMFEALLRKGYTLEAAARISQSETGQSLMTGKKPKRKRK